MATSHLRWRSAPRTLVLALGAVLGAAVGACDSDNGQKVDAGRGGSGGSSTGSGGTTGTGGSTGSGGTTGSGGSTGSGGGSGGSADGGTDVAPTGAGGATGTGGSADGGTDVRADAGTGGTGGSTDGGAAGADGGVVAITDTDMIAVRFNADGTPDTTFGTSGVVRVDLGAGVGNVRDAIWNVGHDATDRVLLFGGKKADGATRVDSDRAVVRLTTAGAVDTTFGTMGVHTLNVANLSDNARNGIVLPSGKIVTAGYTGQPTGVGNQVQNRPVVLRLNDNGTADTTFGAAGIVNYNPFMSTSPTVLWGLAEAYGVGVQSTGAVITTGYGRSDPALTTLNLISLRFTAAGVPDPTWATGGFLELDIAGDTDRGRNLVVLPGDRVFMVGSATPAAANVDAMALFLTPNGALDTTFNTTGYKLYKFDDRPDEAFFGVALSPNNMFVAAAGYRAGGTGNNDDATMLIIPLGAGTEVAQAVPLSTTANDRFWGATFDANNKLLTAGFVNVGGDNRMVVARFNTDGSRDTTFGTDGVATINASAAGVLEEARGVTVLSTGKIVVAGVAEHL